MSIQIKRTIYSCKITLSETDLLTDMLSVRTHCFNVVPTLHGDIRPSTEHVFLILGKTKQNVHTKALNAFKYWKSSPITCSTE